jgi:hypothetical protein
LKKSLATDEDITDTQVRNYIKKGGAKKVQQVIQAKKAGQSDTDTRESVMEALKSSMGKPTITESDAELFLDNAAADEVGEAMEACRESGTANDECDKIAEDIIAKSVTGGSQMNAKQKKMKLNKFRRKAAKKELSALKEGCLSETTDASVCKSTMKAKLKSLLGLDTVTDDEVEKVIIEGAQDKALDFMEACKEDPTKTAASCRDNEVTEAIKQARGKSEVEGISKSEVQETVNQGFKNFVASRISACIRAAEDDANKITACTSSNEMEKDLKKIKVESSDTVEEDVIERTVSDAKESAVQTAATSLQSIPNADKHTEFQSMVKEEIGLDLEQLETDDKHMAEQILVKEARTSEMAAAAKACSLAGTETNQCDIDSIDTDFQLGKTDGGRRLAKSEIRAKKVRQEAAEKIAESLADACMDLNKAETKELDANNPYPKMKACLENDAEYTKVLEQVVPEKQKKRTMEKAKKRKVAKEMKTAMKVYLKTNPTEDQKKTKRAELKKQMTDKLKRMATTDENDDQKLQKLEEPEALESREAGALLMEANDCADGNKDACEDEAKKDIKDLFGKEEREMDNLKYSGAKTSITEEGAGCDESSASKVDCDTEVKEKMLKFVSEDQYKKDKPKMDKLREAKKAGKSTLLKRFPKELRTTCKFDGSCNDKVIEQARVDVGKAAKSDDEYAAPTKVVSKGKIGDETKCTVVLKTLCKNGDANAKGKLVAAKTDIGTPKGQRRLNSRHLNGASSVSSGVTEEEVVDDDEEDSTEDYTGSEIKEEGTETVSEKPVDKDKPPTSDDDEEADEEADAGKLSSASTLNTKVATTAIVCFLAALLI